jgi:hypothetical protein
MRAKAAVLLALTVLMGLAEMTFLRSSSQRRALASRGVQTTAAVILLEDPREGVYFHDAPPLITYGFEAEGRWYEGVERISHSEYRDLGAADAVQIVYLPEQPHVHLLARHVKAHSVTVALGAVVSATIVLAAAWLWLAQAWLRSRGLKRGRQSSHGSAQQLDE